MGTETKDSFQILNKEYDKENKGLERQTQRDTIRLSALQNYFRVRLVKQKQRGGTNKVMKATRI